MLGSFRFDIEVPESLRLRGIDEGQSSVRKKMLDAQILEMNSGNSHKWKTHKAGAKNRLQDLRVIPRKPS